MRNIHKLTALFMGALLVAATFGCEMTEAKDLRRGPIGDTLVHWDMPGYTLAPIDWNLDVDDPAVEYQVAPLDLEPVVTEREDALVSAPLGYDAGGDETYPLVVFLHGYNGNATDHAYVVGLFHEYYSSGDFVLMLPEGTTNQDDAQFWDAGENCCDYYGDNPGDEQWLLGQIELAQEQYRISKVYLYGTSNGGFMSYHLACRHADLIDGVVSFAGMLYDDTAECQPTEPVSVLHIHGTVDTYVAYEGLASDAPMPLQGGYPGAVETVDVWRAHNNCAAEATHLTNLDLDGTLEGDETYRETWSCDGSTVALWTMDGGGHVPDFNTATFGTETLNWLLAQ